MLQQASGQGWPRRLSRTLNNNVYLTMHGTMHATCSMQGHPACLRRVHVYACYCFRCDTFSKCWEEDPTDRPSFSELSRSIIAFFQPQTTPNETEYKLFSLDRDYTKTIPEDYLTPQTTNDYLTPVRMNTYVKQSPAYDTAADYDTASTEDVDADGCILPSSSFTLAV